MLPSVFDYSDYRAYLSDWFSAKKDSNPRYSHRVFVRRTGRTSPSLLSDVIKGRRNLTQDLVEAFCKALDLQGDDARFFADLVQLDQAETVATRKEAWHRVAATRRFQDAHRLEGGGYRFLTHWYYPVIRELTALDEFREDAAWIAQRLAPNVTPAQAQEALDTIIEVGLVERVEGRLRPRDVAIVTPKQVQGWAVHEYHQGMLALAHQAIVRFKSSQRHFTTVTVAVPSAALAEVRAELDAMTRRILHLCEAHPDAKDQVVQVQLHYFPVAPGPGDA